MLKQQIPLHTLSLPWNASLDSDKMKTLPKDQLLSDLDPLEVGKDIALQDTDGTYVGWIPFSNIVQTVFKQWKICLAYYETLLQAVDDAITAVDGEGNIVSWNPKSEEIFQCSHDEIVGKPITDFFEEDSIEVMSTLKDGKGVIRKYHQPYPDVYVLINSLPVVMDQSIIGGISVERDITDVVKLNEELSATTAYIQDLERKMDKKQSDPFHPIKGRSPALREAVGMAKKVAAADVPVLITGESGVGKELFASAIHKASPRAEGPFIAINCGAIPASLFESELFGYEKGAFTGANKEGKKGKIDIAKGGTLFLDEIGEMPLDLQVKLLRVLQEKQFYRIGGNKPNPVDVRIIAATNRDLEKMIEEGLFRQDLYYRLNVVSIPIPSLRERMEDIPELIQLCLKEFSVKYSKPIPDIDPEVMYLLLHHDWPGNIRQLRNTIERIMILVDEEVIQPHHLPNHLIKKKENKSVRASALEQLPADSEEMQIRSALMKTYGNKSAAAKLLGVSRATLYNKIKKYGLSTRV
ncbi:sigma-54-dependent Fis family transcriptional regulator [Marinithermofilum abyssi]|uniref:Sigma-54-dependent Fis family transcriptional regulator n=1 Tax=Marinithermofilum abyssi TaxID=1571185 RepID=A0A8J2VG91_9BACL|nr:sigma 54-interacting transcriptional regulator [Marinithermofilum abyssi]GGE06705.1 sigma-54-dependent Fis family transcriptional regulator [Marinithermofilum abyssi]